MAAPAVAAETTGPGWRSTSWSTPPRAIKIAAFLQKNASELGIEYLIWKQRIWRPATSNSWRGMSDRGSPTANHMDHVHANT